MVWMSFCEHQATTTTILEVVIRHPHTLSRIYRLTTQVEVTINGFNRPNQTDRQVRVNPGLGVIELLYIGQFASVCVCSGQARWNGGGGGVGV